MHRIVPSACFLTGETLQRALMDAVRISLEFGGRGGEEITRRPFDRCIALQHRELKALVPPNDRSRDNVKRNRRGYCDNDVQRAAVDMEL
jgi:hypothetical protein